MDSPDYWDLAIDHFTEDLRKRLDTLYQANTAELHFRLMGEVVANQPDWSEELARRIRETVELVHRALFLVPGADQVIIPLQWWETGMGQLCSWAMLWADQDEAITVKEAAKLLGVGLSAVSNMIDRGALRAVIADTINPQRGRRQVSRKEVERLAGE